MVHEAVRVRIRQSKTNVFGHGEWLFLRRVEGQLCPVAVIAEYLALGSISTTVLAHQDGAPLSKFQFGSVFKKCLSVLGLDATQFGTHSFRIGATTEAARAGLANSDIQRIGRWRSTCYASYVRPELVI